MLRSLAQGLPRLSAQQFRRVPRVYRWIGRASYCRLRFYATSPSSSAPPIKLRDYQEECIQSVLSSLEQGHKRLGISLATGSGKTVIFTQLISRINPPSPAATQTLVLAHRRELVEQAAQHCTAAYPDKRVEVEMGPVHASGHADITVASVQSITSRDRLDKFDPSRFKLVLVDEAHHIVAPGYLRVLAHFGLDAKRPGSPALVGVSATLSRFDGLRLGAAIDEIVYHRDYVDMISDKWLSDVIFTTVQSSADVSSVRSGSGGDFRAGELSRAVNTDQVNEITVRSWLAHAAGRKSTLAFCVDLAHVASLARKFREHGQDARVITGDTPAVERGRCLDAFRRREFPVLVNCGVFTEGTDIPGVDCVVLARPTKSRNLLVQMIGRGMRLFPGKENCHVIDMVSSLETGIVTTPTLFGLDPGEIVQGATPKDLRGRGGRQEGQDPYLRTLTDAISSGEQEELSPPDPDVSVTFTQYDSVLDLISDTSAEKHIHALTPNAWVHVGSQKYVLTAPSGTYLRIEPPSGPPPPSSSSPPLYRALEIRALPPGVAKSPFAAPRELLVAGSLADAVRGCDAYAAANFPRAFIHRYQRWRSAPPTEGQLRFLNKLRGKGAEPLSEGDVTKGEAMEMITRVRHGARGQFAALGVERRRRDKVVRKGEAEVERRMREVVSVGPVRY